MGGIGTTTAPAQSNAHDRPVKPAGANTDDAVSWPVCIAFQLGWDMSSLYHQARPRRGPEKFEVKADQAGRERYPKLPAQSDFDRTQRTERRLIAVTAGLARLKEGFESAGFQPPSTTRVREAFEAGADRDALEEAIYRMHLRVLLDLQAADPRLGSAYNVGRALEATRAVPHPDLQDQFRTQRINGLCNELDDLVSALPPHAGRAVTTSLRWWQHALTPKLTAGKRIDRQAEQWRALLSGEKHGPDVLQPEDYTTAANLLLERAAGIVLSALRTHWRSLLITSALVVAGLAAAIVFGGVSGTLTGIAAAAAAFGVSWKGIGSAVAGLASRLRGPLWGAELDLAIARAITDDGIRKAFDELPEEEGHGNLPAALWTSASPARSPG